MSAPTPADQIQFLSNIQRLLSEGSFSATYKYALLLALADLSVEVGSDDETQLLVDTKTIADKFILYYWRQTVPYSTGNPPAGRILYQNTNPLKGATALTLLQNLRRKSDGSIAKARANKPAWRSCISNMALLIEKMPLWKLQTISGKPFCFLYENEWAQGKRGFILLKPGVAYSFRRFYSLLQALIQDAWIRYIRELKANQSLLGQVNDLGEFLFGCGRDNLAAFIPVLMPIQNGDCFYCGSRLATSPCVDHFIPWSRYSMDLAHNFVIAHSSCNVSKSNYLPALQHLENWLSRNHEQHAYLSRAFDERRLMHNLETSIHVARWAYEQAESSGAYLWLAKHDLRRLEPAWRALFT